MDAIRSSRPARIAGRIFAAALLIFGAQSLAVPEDIDSVVQRADQIKYARNGEFLAALKQLDAQSAQLTQLQRDWLAYFHAWQLGYRGDYPQALTAFHTLLAQTQNPIIRSRSRISLIYDQVNSARFEDAYDSMNVLLESLPTIKDGNTRFLILVTAAFLYGNAGQYDLALQYIEQLIANHRDDRSMCITVNDKVQILYEAGKLRADDPLIRAGIEACQRIGDPLYANETRILLTLHQIDHGHAVEALKILNAHAAEILATHSATTISEFQSALARAYLATGDFDRADKAAQSAIDNANSQVNARSVASAYKVLYQVAKRHGAFEAALAWYEKYANSDKAYLDDVSARALAYQMVHQRVLDKQRQLDAANDKNQMLGLKQQVDAQKAKSRLAYIAMLVLGLALVAMWAYRTKRAQVKFQKLARRDGLTGIHNRQHFFETAQDALRYCAKSSREASVLALDLDHFKSVNDMHGHAAGDEALRRVVAACQARLRSIDIFGRLGGEEFAIVLPDCSENAASQRAEEMRANIADLPRFDAYADVLVTASFGVASSRACGYNLTTLLANADSALYAAKHAGRNRVVRHQGKVKVADT